ncbi:hypothetical protein [Flavobacterium noncentrifugens]|nr:hypothetical protein [Flavobacterium noncentrifugens]
MKYYTYWSIADLPTNSIKSYEVFLYISIICLITWICIKRYKKNNKDYEKLILLWIIGSVFIFSTSMFAYLTYIVKDDIENRIQAILTSPKVAQVEGVISGFKRERPASQRRVVTIESFMVDSVKFSYGDAMLGRFNSFSETNSILQNGLHVRITYGKVKNQIVKIEIEN